MQIKRNFKRFHEVPSGIAVVLLSVAPTGCSFLAVLECMEVILFASEGSGREDGRVFNELTLHPMKRSFQQRQFHFIAVV